MATSPANPAEIQDSTKKDHGKPVQAKDQDKPEEEGGWAGGEQGSRGDTDRRAEKGDTTRGNK